MRAEQLKALENKSVKYRLVYLRIHSLILEAVSKEENFLELSLEYYDKENEYSIRDWAHGFNIYIKAIELESVIADTRSEGYIVLDKGRHLKITWA